MKNVLFVCLGNICRSPAAEGILKGKIKERNLEDEVYCDSAGTSAYHEGEDSDPRMKIHAEKRGHKLESISRQFHKDDFDKFDFIIAMDNNNYRDLLNFDEGGRYHAKIMKMVDFCKKFDVTEVPDPYFGGDKGFEFVLDILEDGCDHLIEQLEKN